MRAMMTVGALLLGVASSSADASPWTETGDLRLRQDLQLLADYGVIQTPGQTWPRPWPEIANAVEHAKPDGLPDHVAAALSRVRTEAAQASASDDVRVQAVVDGALKPRQIRTFEDTPREKISGGASAEWFSNSLAFKLQVRGAYHPSDDQRIRLDGSYASALIGNWIVTAGAVDRWWGPGHEGSLILSSNARPVPMITIDRNYADAFETRWLSWIGPWRLSVGAGVLESKRDFSHTQLLTARVAARPFESLDLALGRSIMWCGSHRPCSSHDLKNVLFGNESQLDPNKNPGNQLASLEFRWRLPRSWVPLAIYGQLVGEDGISPNGTLDIKSYLPAKRLHQVGLESWGSIRGNAVRVHAEFADTVCRFSVPNTLYNCAYEHTIYTTGYRFRGHALGHSIDGDGRSYSIGGTLLDSYGDPWTAVIRRLELNMAGLSRGNTLTRTPQKLYNIELTHRRDVKAGTIELGIGYDHVTEGTASSRLRAQARFTFNLN